MVGSGVPGKQLLYILFMCWPGQFSIHILSRLFFQGERLSIEGQRPRLPRRGAEARPRHAEERGLGRLPRSAKEEVGFHPI